ncbi:MAG: choice-of-anchor D domain-containing protein [Bdellovibrionota bacterium]|nr:choice-of-anchor D domain-containing protein [Bdellovibrionota bacterium]
MKSILPCLLALFLFAACSPKSEKSATSIVINAGFLGGGGFSGGAVIYGKGPEGQNFSLVVAGGDTSESIELDEGEWNIAAIGWNGSNPLTGTVECGLSNVTAQGVDTLIDVVVRPENCTNILFSPAAFRNGNSFKNLELIGCDDNSGKSAGDNCDGAQKGGVRSFQVVLPSYRNGTVTSSRLASTCYSDSGTTDSTISSNLTIPVSRSTAGYIKTRIRAYSGPNCTGGVRLLDFENGLVNGASLGSPLLYPSGLKTQVFVSLPKVPPLLAGYDVNSMILNQGKFLISNSPINQGGEVTAYSIAPALPAGITLNTTTGEISGTPTVTSTSTTYTITATGPEGSDSTTISMVVGGPVPSITTYTESPAVHIVGETLSPNNPTTAGPPATYFSITPEPPAGISFNPATGSLSGSPTNQVPNRDYRIIAHNANGESHPYLLNLEVNTPANIEVNFPSVPYGNVIIGNSIDANLTYTNSGGTQATAFTDTFSNADFSGSTTCTATLAPGASCSYTVTFAPSTNSLYTDTLDINYHNGLSIQTTTSSLTGRGLLPANLTISEADPYNFGTFATSDSDRTHTFTVTNTGEVTATSISESGLATAFSFAGGSFPGTGGTCSSSLTAGSSCTLNVSFDTASAAAYSSSITLDYHNGVTTTSSIRSLIGTILTPAQLTINSGSNVYLGVLPAYPTNPSSDLGAWDASSNTPTLTDGSGSDGQYYTNSGAGTVDFGNGDIHFAIGDLVLYHQGKWHRVGAITDQALTVTNTGEYTASNINILTLTAPYSIKSTDCGATLAGSASCTITIETKGLEVEKATENITLNYQKDFDGNFEAAQISLSAKIGRILKIAAGDNHKCALFELGKVKCWGNNSFGQLGLGNTTPLGINSSTIGENIPFVDLGSGVKARDITAGENHNCVLTTTNEIKCWGANGNGQLGIGSLSAKGASAGDMGDNLPVVDFPANSVRGVYAGGKTTCALLVGPELKCWGYNNRGQLGQGDTSIRGHNAANLPKDLPAIALGTIAFKGVSVGSAHVCVNQDTDDVRCWGENSQGQLGQESTGHIGNVGGQISSLSKVELGGTALDYVSAGNRTSCAILENDKAKCWGLGEKGQLGQENSDNIGDQTSEMGLNLLKINLPGVHKVMSQTQDQVTCLYNDNDDVYCFGNGAFGGVGNGSTDVIGDSAGEISGLSPLDFGTGRSVLKLFPTTTCAELDNHEVKCWGKNNSGQLGIGTALNMGDNAGEMGDNLPPIEIH